MHDTGIADQNVNPAKDPSRLLRGVLHSGSISHIQADRVDRLREIEGQDRHPGPGVGVGVQGVHFEPKVPEQPGRG